MRRIIGLAGVCIFLFVLSSICLAARPKSMNEQRTLDETTNLITQPSTASGLAVTGACSFGGIIIKTDGANDITVNVYDSLTASGNKLIPTDTLITGASRLVAIDFNPPLNCTTGVYVSVSVAGGGGSATYQVIYRTGE